MGGKFKAVKLCQSSSISGPDETLNPIFENMSIISFRTAVIGCELPKGANPEGSVKSLCEEVEETAEDSSSSINSLNLS